MVDENGAVTKKSFAGKSYMAPAFHVAGGKVLGHDKVNPATVFVRMGTNIIPFHNAGISIEPSFERASISFTRFNN